MTIFESGSVNWNCPQLSRKKIPESLMKLRNKPIVLSSETENITGLLDYSDDRLCSFIISLCTYLACSHFLHYIYAGSNMLAAIFKGQQILKGTLEMTFIQKTTCHIKTSTPCVLILPSIPSPLHYVIGIWDSASGIKKLALCWDTMEF